jgi:hypothetical protein
VDKVSPTIEQETAKGGFVVRALVFLHGIGDGDPELAWLSQLDRTLVLLGMPPVDPRAVVAPQYADLLGEHGHEAQVPDITERIRDDRAARRGFERRQAALYRRLSSAPGVRGFGFGAMPGVAMHGGQFLGLHAPHALAKQVNRYVSNEGTRGAVLRRILAQLPEEGDIVLVGHSLGSVVAIDLLDHLPTTLHVRRFITLGSPANIEALHKSSGLLLKKFPYGRVDDWTNFLGHRDPVPGGRGLSNHFPGAQDFEISLGPGLAHSAAAYLEQAPIAALVGELMTDRPSAALTSTSTAMVLRVDEEQENILLGLAFGHALAAHTKDDDTAVRYRSALGMVQDRILADLRESAEASGRALPEELAALASGQPPTLPRRIEMTDAVRRLTTLAESNLIAPYEIDTGKAVDAALPAVAVRLGFAPTLGARVGQALAEVREHTGRRGVPWGRVLTGAAGLALIAAGPVGLVVAAPAAAFGGAAIVGGLAAFGPGGMVGGMALMGGLAAGGAAVAVGAAAVGHANVSSVDLAGALLLRVAEQRALQLLDLERDPAIWSAVASLETALAAELARLRPFSDAKTAGIADRERALVLVGSLLNFLRKHGLEPAELDAGEDGESSVPTMRARVSLRRIGR